MKTELRIVFLSRDGKAFISKEEVVEHENNKNQKRKGNSMTITDLIQKVLKENNWGIYYKSKPLQNLQVQDGVPLLRVNDVEIKTVCQKVDNILNELEERKSKWNEQSNSQKDSQQEKS